MLFEESEFIPGSLHFTVAASDVQNTARCSVSSSLGDRAGRVAGSKIKRLLDLAIAAFMVVFLMPLMLVIAAAIKLDSRGAVLFRQKRYGLNRQTFTMLKFRSMTVSEGSGAFLQAQRGDTRITRVGTFLRRTSLDELPQLFNVLTGNMSIVGPRPHAVAMDDAFSAVLPFYDDRHLVRPGLTGLAQISGCRGPTDEVHKIITRIRHDRAYIHKWSVLFDLKIMLLTPLRLSDPNAF